ncbi:uncharacterized protein N7518_006488 [Penicillium psychrosexuale]|uniref:uncharacterized protein n=1 Tax=Penicillium psychrosexuale TaxID=1002107 RepID=UPI002545BB69|nr:uncharacterized protein N7518_006488 [Penicillium psychrosexuale]KAJ5789477.1 hypothetical protein N7518_006488 [Penicillium psychrosexuale]
MVTPGPTATVAGRSYGAILDKREGAKRETITRLGECTIGSDPAVTAPPYTNGYDWFNSEAVGEIEGTQTSMPRWFHKTTAGACSAMVTKESDLSNLPAGFNNGATMDYAWEMGWLKDFFNAMFTGVTAEIAAVNKGVKVSPLSCEQGEEIFFGCSGNRLQSIYGALASDTNFDYIGISQELNRIKASIAKSNFGGKGYDSMVGAAGAIKESTAWVGKKEAIKDLKTLGARIKFRTKLEKLQQMLSLKASFGQLDLNQSAADYSQTERQQFTYQFKTFMTAKSGLTTYVQASVDEMVNIMDTEVTYLTTIAGNSGETNALTEASSMIAAYAALRSTYGLDSGGTSVCSPTISWDFTEDSSVVLKRDTDDTTTAATLCSLKTATSITTSAEVTATFWVWNYEYSDCTDEETEVEGFGDKSLGCVPWYGDGGWEGLKASFDETKYSFGIGLVSYFTAPQSPSSLCSSSYIVD